ncbi:hypothetical protein E4U03_07075 [Rothia nasimurium]|uniref:Uncharacterized protein n=1 Tax=Rothia nasimurium TaxID=85336 RepID=A0A4Y9F5Q4_9MICC|nr:hypothetical protein [Rothia nasimurium]MBF0808369.1 hypothetical protein [Rothia nasimurium]TFU22186.1 hypothetical protein E4U03_07075 [Rothia nasimurium]
MLATGFLLISDPSVAQAAPPGGTTGEAAAQGQVVELLEEQPDVEYAEPDLIITTGQAATPRNSPSDPYFASHQWNMRAIDAPGAWRYATGEGIIIGIAIPGRPGTPN